MVLNMLFIGNMRFKQRLEGGEAINGMDIWRKRPADRGKAGGKA